MGKDACPYRRRKLGMAPETLPMGRQTLALPGVAVFSLLGALCFLGIGLLAIGIAQSTLTLD